METGAVYLQPITMAPEGMMRKASDSDIHLEADIHAVKNNPTGFAEGDWMPYLQVTYELTKAGTTQSIKGDLMPMVANDGPHYGDNVKLFGPGKYHLKLHISPPAQNGPHGVRPSRRQGNGRGPVVQAVHDRIRLPVRRHRQEGRLLRHAFRGALLNRPARLIPGRLHESQNPGGRACVVGALCRHRARRRSADVQARNERRQAEPRAHRSAGGTAHQDRSAQHRQGCRGVRKHPVAQGKSAGAGRRLVRRDRAALPRASTSSSTIFIRRRKA